MRINHAAMVFRLSPAQQSGFDKLLEEQQDPDSPNYHKWLTPEQYAARFGMSDADLAKVSAWLKSQGLTVNGFSRARTRVFFSGTAAQVENAFRTELTGTGGRRKPLRQCLRVSVPMALSGMVLGVRGLDNFRPRPRARIAKPTLLLTYQEIISCLPLTSPPSITSNRFMPPDWMEPERRLRSSDKPRLTSRISTLSAAPPGCLRQIFSWFRGRHHRVLFRG